MDSADDVPDSSIVPDPHALLALRLDDRKVWLNELCNRIFDRFIQFSFNVPLSAKPTPAESDSVSEYSIQLWRMCCFFKEYCDAIRQSDGDRLINTCYQSS